MFSRHRLLIIRYTHALPPRRLRHSVTTFGQWGTTTGHVIGPNSHYDVIDFAFLYGYGLLYLSKVSVG